MKRQAHITLAAALVLVSAAPWQPADAAQFTNPALNFSLTYPDSWHALTWASEPNVVLLRSFPDDQALHGGNVPFGGAEINVNVFPPYPPGWSAGTDEYAEYHAIAARTGTIIGETTRASGAPARVKWTRSTASGTTNTCIATVVRLRGRVFDISMEYQSPDPAGPQYEQVLSDLLASLSVPAGSPTPSIPPTP